MKILAIVPARGGSKGIKHKNIRFLNNKPLIFYVLETLTSLSFEAVVVTTDDEEIAQITSGFPVLLRKRPEYLAEDNVPLDPVISDSVNWVEKKLNKSFDLIITIQPTSPLLSIQTVNDAVLRFGISKADTLVSVVNSTHLEWVQESRGFVPAYQERNNRQWLPQKMRETGGLVICKRDVLYTGSRFGEKVEVFEVPLEESVDIDNSLDWYLCSSLLNRMNITFVVMGNSQIGMGHVYRALTLADYWLGHKIQFILLTSSQEALELICDRGYKVIEVEDIENVKASISTQSIVINDFLDTERSYTQALKKKEIFIINFEDLGEGVEEADLVFNALYERFNPPPNHYYGYKYECLNEAFLREKPNEFRNEVKSILVTFGGSDPANLTLKTLQTLERILPKATSLKLVVGPGYGHFEFLEQYLEEVWCKNIYFQYFKAVSNMAKIMRDVDLAITSNGRTIYELASMGIPTISIAQNDRESQHLFARYSKGIKYLGISSNITQVQIESALKEMLFDPIKRKLMYDSLPIYELRNNLQSITDIIQFEYKRWKNEFNKNWRQGYYKREIGKTLSDNGSRSKP